MSEKYQNIKNKAVELAIQEGLINLTREKLCNAVGLPVGSFPLVVGSTFTQFISEIADEVGDAGYHHPTTTNRANPNFRKTQILNIAIDLSKDIGYQNVTRSKIADRAKISESLITNYFSTMNQLRREVMRAAIKKEIYEIIAQGIVANDDRAKKAPTELKEKALKHLAG